MQISCRACAGVADLSPEPAAFFGLVYWYRLRPEVGYPPPKKKENCGKVEK